MIIIRNPIFDWNWRFCQKWWNLALLSVISIWFISQKLSRRPTLFNWLKHRFYYNINNGISFTSEFWLDWSARSSFKSRELICETLPKDHVVAVYTQCIRSCFRNCPQDSSYWKPGHMFSDWSNAICLYFNLYFYGCRYTVQFFNTSILFGVNLARELMTLMDEFEYFSAMYNISPHINSEFT